MLSVKVATAPGARRVATGKGEAMRGILLVITAILAANGPASSEESAADVAKTLTVIVAPSSSATESTKKRFAFILPALVERCSDIGKPSKAGDMLAMASKLLNDRGLGDEEGLLQVSVNLHRLTAEVSAYTASANVPLKCAEIWSMYINARQNGQTPTESVRGVAGIVKALSRLAK